MDENEIETLFNHYAQLLSEIKRLTTELDIKRGEIMAQIPEDLKRQFDEIDVLYNGKIEELQSIANRMKTTIENAVKMICKTIKTECGSAVFYNGKKTVDIKALKGYAIDHPEAASLINVGEPYVVIRINDD